MKKLQVKRAARRFIRSGYLRDGIIIERHPRGDDSLVIVERQPRSTRLYAEIIRRLGHPGHWNSPFIIDIYP